MLKSWFEMSYHEWKQAQECSQLAISQETLEDQHLIEYGPHTDINGDK